MPEPPKTSESELAKKLTGALTRQQAIRLVAKALADAGINGAPRDARILLSTAAACSTLELISSPEIPLGPAAAERLAAMVHRRTLREPVSRIAGEREFYGRPFEVTPATLDPRPDSETIIDATLELVAAEGLRSEDITILDIGTGSGCLIVTLLAELQGARATAVDICPHALTVAKRNAARHGVADRVSFLEADALEDQRSRYNLIVSNPPYIPSAEIATLAAEVRDFDPVGALDGGLDGLDIYRRIAKRLSGALADQGPAAWAIFEVGAKQATSVASILRSAGFKTIRLFKDLSGHTRCVAVRSRS